MIAHSLVIFFLATLSACTEEISLYQLMQDKCPSTYRRLLVDARDVFKSNPGMVHAKISILDSLPSHTLCNSAMRSRIGVLGDKLDQVVVRLPSQSDMYGDAVTVYQTYMQSVVDLVVNLPLFKTLTVISESDATISPNVELDLLALLRMANFTEIEVFAMVVNPDILHALAAKTSLTKLTVLNQQFGFYCGSQLMLKIKDLAVLEDGEYAVRETTLPAHLPNLRSLQLPTFGNTISLMQSNYSSLITLKLSESRHSIWNLLELNDFLHQLEELDLEGCKLNHKNFEVVVRIMIRLRRSLKRFSMSVATFKDDKTNVYLRELLEDNAVLESLTLSLFINESSFGYLVYALKLKRFVFLGDYMGSSEWAFRLLLGFVKHHESLKELALSQTAYSEDVYEVNLGRFEEIIEAVNINKGIHKITLSFKVNLSTATAQEVYQRMHDACVVLAARNLTLNGFVIADIILAFGKLVESGAEQSGAEQSVGDLVFGDLFGVDVEL